MSVPRSAAHLPVFYNGKDHGYRGYVDQPATARHAFGHGLSYTTVEYGAPRLTRPAATVAEFDEAGGAPPLVCSVQVRNTGGRPVRETVQLYVRRVLGGTSWPRVRELRGFRHTRLAPGETAEVSFTVDARTLASVSRSGEREVEAGEFAIEAGPSSARTRAARLTVHPCPAPQS
ncbi:Periplasmic beta-glucosidase precursor [Streptomyces sp. ADI96-15]|nr:Periplasmic beta-glucosidase precursor [Streptomyces sp. ADI96-15]